MGQLLQALMPQVHTGRNYSSAALCQALDVGCAGHPGKHLMARAWLQALPATASSAFSQARACLAWSWG